MKRLVILLLSISFLLTSCDRNDTGGIDGSDYTYLFWMYEERNEYHQVYRMQLRFLYLGNGYYEMLYESIGTESYDPDNYIRGAFEIAENTKSFSEWNECSIKLPIDMTKNWLFRFEGKNIPTNISALWDIDNTSEYTLVLWDSVSNTKYDFKKKIFKK